MGLPVANPTYLLASNWTFRPDGPIALGNIIADPLKPHIVLSRPDPATKQLETATVSENDFKLVDEGGRSLSLGIWTNFLESIPFKLGAEHDRKLRTEYSIETLETIYFRDGVTPELVQERAKDPIIRRLMKPDSILSKPVFMITGVKIAKVLRVASKSASGYSGELGAGSPTGGPVSVGGEGKFGVQKAQAYGFSSENVVFAYQLLKMAPKGWGKNRAVRGTEYQSTGVFLGDDGGDDGDVQLEVEFTYFETADLNDLGLSPNHAVNEKQETVANGKENYSVISQQQKETQHTNAGDKNDSFTAPSK